MKCYFIIRMEIFFFFLKKKLHCQVPTDASSSQCRDLKNRHFKGRVWVGISYIFCYGSWQLWMTRGMLQWPHQSSGPHLMMQTTQSSPTLSKFFISSVILSWQQRVPIAKFLGVLFTTNSLRHRTILIIESKFDNWDIIF